MSLSSGNGEAAVWGIMVSTAIVYMTVKNGRKVVFLIIYEIKNENVSAAGNLIRFMI